MTIELAAISGQRADVFEALAAKGYIVHRVEQAKDWVQALAPVAPRIRGVLSSGMAGLPTALIDALPALEICVLNGVGLETTDLVTARKRGILVTTTPVLFDDVADLAVVLGMAAARRIAVGDRFVRAGQWMAGRMPPAKRFWGKRYGILGLGRIGQALARRLRGFGGQIHYFDPLPKQVDGVQALGSAMELARNVDFLFLCAAGSPGASAKIVDRAILEALGPNGVFVNIARGWLVDEPALVELLVAKRLGAAGLDVFDQEPSVPEALLGLDNVVLTPHVASATEDCASAMAECVLANVLGWFEGKKAVTPVL